MASSEPGILTRVAKGVVLVLLAAAAAVVPALALAGPKDPTKRHTADPTFDAHGGAVTLDSEVDLYATKAMALADWRTANLRLLRSCLAEIFAKTTGVHVTVTAATRPVPVRAERALAFRFELTASGGVPYDIDLIALGKGRTTVLLSVDGPKGSYTGSLLTPVARLLAQRLAAHA